MTDKPIPPAMTRLKEITNKIDRQPGQISRKDAIRLSGAALAAMSEQAEIYQRVEATRTAHLAKVFEVMGELERLIRTERFDDALEAVQRLMLANPIMPTDAATSRN